MKIKHDPEDDKILDKSHSTFRIENFISLRDWGQHPSVFRKFAVAYRPIGYTYLGLY